MSNRSITQRLTRGLVITALLGYGMAAMAQAEPTLNQVYEAAQAGHLEQAQVMMQQVLVAHPGSAKAHFVQAELLARQGQMSRAREALATAEKLAPGLPFAKPASVQNLRAQLTAKPAAQATTSPALHAAAAPMAAPPAPSSPFPWGLALLLGGAAIGLGIYMLRKKSPDAPTSPVFSNAQQPAYAPAGGMQGGGLGGPQSFGMGNPGAPAQPYGQPAYGQQPYGQPVGSGLGGRVMGGLATGLAVGAGVMAAQAIGKSLMGNNEHPQPHQLDNAANNDYVPLNSNNDLGGQNFGINDTSSWDDGNAIASSGDGGDGGDWDS